MRKLLFILCFLGSLVANGQSTSLITIGSMDIFDLSGVDGKSIKYLFDGNTSTRFDADNITQAALFTPTSSFVVLPGNYNNMKIETYQGANAPGATMQVKLYNNSKSLLATVTITPSVFNAWATTNINSYTNVRFVELIFPDALSVASCGIYEVKLYGDLASSASSIFPGTSIIPIADPGKWAHGINCLDDQGNQYDDANPSIKLLDTIAATRRIYYEGTRWDYIPDGYNGSLVTQPLWLGRFGTDHFNTRVFNSARTGRFKAHITLILGGSIKEMNSTDGTNTANNTSYIPQEYAKYTDQKISAVNPNLDTSWDAAGELVYNLAALYGTNTSAVRTKYVLGGDSTSGQGGADILEIGNELDGAFGPNNGLDRYHSPQMAYELMKKAYARGKAADPNLKLYWSAQTYMRNAYWKALYFYHFWNYGGAFPGDGFCMNAYFNNDYDGQGGGGNRYGVPPESWGLYNRLVELKSQFDLMYPNKAIKWTEHGYASSATNGDNSTPWEAYDIAGKAAKRVAADWTLRSKAIAQTIRLIEEYDYYAFWEAGGVFNSMAASRPHFTGVAGAYDGNEVYPVAYGLANELKVENSYNWFASNVDTANSGCWITVKNHNSDGTKKLYKIWKKSLDGSTASNVVISIPNIISATQYTQSYTSYVPTSTSLTVGTNSLTVPTVTEAMTWIEVTVGASSPVQTGVAKPRGKKVKLATN